MDQKDSPKSGGKLRLSTFSLKTKVSKDKESKTTVLPLWDIHSLDDSNFAVGITFVKKCIQWLRKTEAKQVEGLFRKSGDMAHVEKLQRQIETQEDFEFAAGEDPHVVCALFKRYLRGMEVPLFTNEHYDMFIAADNFPDVKKRFFAIKFALRMIPTLNHSMLYEIFLYLQEVADNHTQNMMTAANLAIVMAPNLLKPLPDASPMTILTMTNHSNSILETIISSVDEIFFGMDELLLNTDATKFKDTMTLLYEVSRRHGEKVLTKIKEENNLSDDEFNNRLAEIAQQAQRGELELGADGNPTTRKSISMALNPSNNNPSTKGMLQVMAEYDDYTPPSSNVSDRTSSSGHEDKAKDNVETLTEGTAADAEIEEEIARAIREIEEKIHFEDNTEKVRQEQQKARAAQLSPGKGHSHSDGELILNHSPRRESKKMERQSSGRAEGRERDRDRGDGEHAQVLNRRSSSKKQGRRLKRDMERRDTKERDEAAENEAREDKPKEANEGEAATDAQNKTVDEREEKLEDEALESPSRPVPSRPSFAELKELNSAKSSDSPSSSVERKNSVDTTSDPESSVSSRGSDGELVVRPLVPGQGRSLKREFSGLRRESSNGAIVRHSGCGLPLRDSIENVSSECISSAIAASSNEAGRRPLKRDFSGKDLTALPVLRREGSRDEASQSSTSSQPASPTAASKEEREKVGSGLARLPLSTMDRSSSTGERLERVSARERRLVKIREDGLALVENQSNSAPVTLTSSDMLSPDSARRKEELEQEQHDAADAKHKRRKSGSPRRDTEEGKERQHSPKLGDGLGDSDDPASTTLNRTSRRRPKSGERDKEKDKERKDEKERKRRDKEKDGSSKPGTPDHSSAATSPESLKQSSPVSPAISPTESQNELLLSPRSVRSSGWIKISKSTDNAMPAGTASNSRHLASNERQRSDLAPSSSSGNLAQNRDRDSTSGSQSSASTSANPSPVAWSSTSPRGSNEQPASTSSGTPIPLIRLNSNRILQVQQQGEASTRSPRKLTKDLSQLFSTSIDIDLDGLGRAPKKIPLVFSMEEQNKLELEVEDEMNRIMSSLEFMSV